MKVFISWSGERSLYVAQYLNEWLPSVIQKVEPWLSVEISKGARWTAEVAKALDETKFGVFCVTPENQSEPWLNFEAGALSKSVGERSFVCAYLIGMKSTDILGPLKDFQLTNTDHDDTLRLIKTMNMAQGAEVLPEKRLEESFRMWWPHLEEKLSNLPAIENPVPATRPPEEIQEETLEIVRRIEKVLTNQTSGVTPFTWGSLASSVLPAHLTDVLKAQQRLSTLLADAAAEKAADKSAQSIMREWREKALEKEKK